VYYNSDDSRTSPPVTPEEWNRRYLSQQAVDAACWAAKQAERATHRDAQRAVKRPLATAVTALLSLVEGDVEGWRSLGYVDRVEMLAMCWPASSECPNDIAAIGRNFVAANWPYEITNALSALWML